MPDRFIIRPVPQGVSVIDLSTGAPAVIGQVPQAGLTKAVPDHLAQLLAARGRNRQRPVAP